MMNWIESYLTPEQAEFWFSWPLFILFLVLTLAVIFIIYIINIKFISSQGNVELGCLMSSSLLTLICFAGAFSFIFIRDQLIKKQIVRLPEQTMLIDYPNSVDPVIIATYPNGALLWKSEVGQNQTVSYIQEGKKIYRSLLLQTPDNPIIRKFNYSIGYHYGGLPSAMLAAIQAGGVEPGLYNTCPTVNDQLEAALLDFENRRGQELLPFDDPRSVSQQQEFLALMQSVVGPTLESYNMTFVSASFKLDN